MRDFTLMDYTQKICPGDSGVGISNEANDPWPEQGLRESSAYLLPVKYRLFCRQERQLAIVACYPGTPLSTNQGCKNPDDVIEDARLAHYSV